MLFIITATILALAGLLVSAAPVPLALAWTDYDVIVVGGGPSGLSALSALARVRRKALLIDSAEYRNSPTRLMHDIVGFDGVPPSYYRWVAQEQLSHYPTVKTTNGTVTNIRPEAGNAYFTVSVTAFDGTASSLTARKIILATGLRDLLPPTPGFAEAFGKGIYWCPWCDGMEHADQPMGVLGAFDQAAEAAAEVLTLNADVVILANGTDTPASRARADARFAGGDASAYLAARNVRVDNRTIARITRLRDGGRDHHGADRGPGLPTVPEYDLFRIEFADGDSVERGVILYLGAKEQRSALGARAGVDMVGGMMAVDSYMRTSVRGIYAVGDANSDRPTNVVHAADTGKTAGVHIQMELEREVSRGIARENIWAQLESSPRHPIDVNQFPLY